MRQWLLFSILLLGTSWVVAQNSTNTQSGQSQTNPGYSTQSGSGQSDSSAMAKGNTGTQHSVVGCLSSSNGTYTLTAKNGKTYQLMGDTSKLSDHVGHEMRVTGTMSSASAGTENAGGGMANNSAGETIEVSSFKHISKTCESGGGMSH
jgi:hypothetical protein